MLIPPYRKSLLHACMGSLLIQWRDIPVSKAVDKLCELGFGTETFVRTCSNGTDKEFKPVDLLWSVNYPLHLARDVRPIRFVGGPKTMLRICSGTLLTLLIDRVLSEVDKEGLDSVVQVLNDTEVYC